MDGTQLRAILEALIFVADEPISTNALGLLLSQDGIETAGVRQVMETLINEYRENPQRGIEVREIAGGYQFRTKPTVAQWIQRLNVPKPTRLSQAAMETMAIIAYRQPIVRAEIEDIRGVDCGGVLKTLLERNVIRIIGKREEPGTPLLYGTTQEFLSIFNIHRLDDLPTLRDLRELEEQRVRTESAEGDLPSSPDVAAQTAPLQEPIQPMHPAVQVALDAEDQVLAHELEEQIRALRHLESAIFPKPIETMTAIERTDEDLSLPEPAEATESDSDNPSPQ